MWLCGCVSETDRLNWQKETETAKANEQIKFHTQANTHRQRHTKAQLIIVLTLL